MASSSFSDFDPFCLLLSDIHPNIIKYLSVEDIKTASQVSQLWYRVLGRRENMKKVALQLPNPDLKIYAESGRRYPNISIRSNKLNICDPKNLRVAKQLCNNAVEVSFRSENLDIAEKFNFPMVKSVEFSWLVESATASRFLDSLNSNQLEHFGSEIPLNIVEVAQKHSRSLTSLAISNHSSDFSLEDVQDLHLRSLDLSFWCGLQDQGARIIRFLRTQVRLEKLSIPIFNNEMLNTILELPRLKTLDVKKISVAAFTTDFEEASKLQMLMLPSYRFEDFRLHYDKLKTTNPRVNKTIQLVQGKSEFGVWQ